MSIFFSAPCKFLHNRCGFTFPPKFLCRTALCEYCVLPDIFNARSNDYKLCSETLLLLSQLSYLYNQTSLKLLLVQVLKIHEKSHFIILIITYNLLCHFINWTSFKVCRFSYGAEYGLTPTPYSQTADLLCHIIYYVIF